MKRYLETLHKRPAHHKKRFALAVSTFVTALIFTFWSMATFGTGGILAGKTENTLARDSIQEVTPLESLSASISQSLGGILDSFSDLKGEVEKVDIGTDYAEMKTNVLEVYGQ